MATVELTKQLLALSGSLPIEISNEERETLMAACEKAKLALESPLEATVRFMFGVRATFLLTTFPYILEHFTITRP
jgi:hypothetical protein